VTDDGLTHPRAPDSLASVTDPANPSADPPPASAPPSRPGATTFTIDGRASPALFVIGWLASLLGIAIAVAGLLGNSVLLVYGVGAGLLSIGLIAACGNQAFERRARGAAYAGPSPFLVFGTLIAVAVFASYVVGSILQAVLGSGVEVFPPLAQLIGALLTGVVFLGVVRLTVVGTGALSWADMRIRRFDRRALDDVAIGAALAVPVIFVTSIVAAVLFAIFQVTPESPLPPTGTTGGLLIQLLIGAAIVPVYEEIVFRGFAITAWERSIGSDRAILRASLLFALAHVVGLEVPGDSTLLQAIGLIVMGAATRLPVAFVLGWIFVRRRSIWASIALHATFNGILIVVAHLVLLAPGG
jgi:membrane protease YdiL (CAAX protease family)